MLLYCWCTGKGFSSVALRGTGTNCILFIHLEALSWRLHSFGVILFFSIYNLVVPELESASFIEASNILEILGGHGGGGNTDSWLIRTRDLICRGLREVDDGRH